MQLIPGVYSRPFGLYPSAFPQQLIRGGHVVGARHNFEISSVWVRIKVFRGAYLHLSLLGVRLPFARPPLQFIETRSQFTEIILDPPRNIIEGNMRDALTSPPLVGDNIASQRCDIQPGVKKPLSDFDVRNLCVIRKVLDFGYTQTLGDGML